MFVLKSHFNSAWNGFDVHELGRVVVNSWLTWLSTNDVEMSRFLRLEDGVDQDLDVGTVDRLAPLGEMLTRTMVHGSKFWEIVWILDIRKAGFVNRDWIVSRRRNRNLFDVVSMLRKHVLMAEEAASRGSPSNMDEWD